MRYLILLLTPCVALTGCKQKKEHAQSFKLASNAHLISAWDNEDVRNIAQDENADDYTYFNRLLDRCRGKNVRGIKNVPIIHGQPNSGTFTYYFEHDVKNPSQPTIIHLPGGPGGGSIGERINLHKFNYINVDPRGIGCNYHSEATFSRQALTSWQTIMDIAQVIETLDLNNFVIYGHSYGTVMATILAAELERNRPKYIPKAVVLEGVVGHHQGSLRLSMENHISKWNRMRSEFPVIYQFFAKGRPNLESLSAEKWGHFLIQAGNKYEEMSQDLLAFIGEWEDWISYGKKGPSILKIEGHNDREENVRDSKARGRDSAMVMSVVGCQELFQDWSPLKVELGSNGDLNLFPFDIDGKIPDMCEGIPPTKIFDSRDFRIKAPLYYFQGETDPQTTLESARYHERHQTEATSIQFIEVKRGGHNVTDAGAPLGQCMDEIWHSIFKAAPFSNLIDDSGRCR